MYSSLGFLVMIQWGVLMLTSCMAVVVCEQTLASLKVLGTEHVGFSPNRQALLAPSEKRREVLGESHEA